jgi:ABC-type Zn2+ transport system substrate-binding protein/surface adhesin
VGVYDSGMWLLRRHRRRIFALLTPWIVGLLGYFMVRPKEGLINQIAYAVILGSAMLFAIYIYPDSEAEEEQHHRKKHPHPHDHGHHTHHHH